MKILLAGTLLLVLGLQDAPAPELRVAREGWGDAGPEDIRAVLRSAAGTLLPLFPDRKFPPLEISRSTSTPITLFQRGPAGEIRVKLNVEGRQWAQFAFQFGHELGHVVCGFAEYPNPNLWFEETLCETSSLFVLGRMAKEWTTKAPYPNWTSYAGALQKYRDERIAAEKLPQGTALAEWFRGQEESLRKDACQRALNLRMAADLLPLFEESPESWAAVAGLNSVHGDATRSFARYLGDWSRSSPEKHRAFIAKIAGRFGVSIDR